MQSGPLMYNFHQFQKIYTYGRFTFEFLPKGLDSGHMTALEMANLCVFGTKFQKIVQCYRYLVTLYKLVVQNLIHLCTHTPSFFRRCL